MKPFPVLLWLLFSASWRGGPAPAAAAGEAPEVLVAQGRLRGRQVSISGAEGSVDIFLGIPYAQPPVGSRRFSRPEPPEPWLETRDATSDPPACLQDLEMGQVLNDAFTNQKEKVPLRISEDCLYLNIFTPARSDHKVKLPVMVWIHGGGLVIGGASTYDGSALATFEQVVVVVIQYRLGILGFYSTGDDYARGNWGLLDQVAALQWIQENIASFGGDPGSVTIFGESAGGGSVSAHVLSPVSKGLFHKAISQSGVALIDGLIQDHPEEVAKNFSETAGCPSSSSSEMVRCLRGKTENEILEVTHKMDSFSPHPVLDSEFFPKCPKALAEEKSFAAVPYMIGVNNHEAGWLIPTALQFPNLTKGLSKEEIGPVFQSLSPFMGATAEHKGLIAEEYLEDAKDPLQLRDRLLELVGDMSFVAPAIVTARAHRDAGHLVYFYEFQHPPSTQAALRPDFVKADHGDEIGFVFGRPFLTGEGTEEEHLLSKVVMKYWANFARNGNPNGDGLVNWPMYNGKERYLEIKIKSKVAEKLRDKQVAFWTETLPEKIAESKRGRGEL